MASLIQALFTCITGTEPASPPTTQYPLEKTTLLSPHPIRTTEETATLILDTLIGTEKSGESLKIKLNEIVGTNGWTERLAEYVLIKLEQALREVNKPSPMLREAYEKSCEAAMAVEGFVREHPVFCMLVAIGVLVVVAPWMAEVLGFVGFGEGGIVEGSFAAAWQARYAGYVPKGSLFSFLQRLGMTPK